MTTPIPMDDLRPDQWVTIRDEIKDVPMSPFGADSELHQFVMRMRSRTPVKPGTPMRVIAVDLPFLYTVVLDADGQEQGPLILDLRRFRVVEISSDVPEAILEFADVKLRSNYEHSLATAATEAAVEAKAEIVKLGLLGDAMNSGDSGDGGDGGDGGEGGEGGEEEGGSDIEGRAEHEHEHDHENPPATNRHPDSKSPSPYPDNGDESEPTEAEPLDHWYRGDEDGEAA